MTNKKKRYIRYKFFNYVIPSVAAMWVYTIYTMVDGIFVARGVNKDALAAINISMPLITMAFAIGIILAVGSSTKASIYKGKNQRDKANEIFTIGTFTVLALGIIFTVIVILNLERLAYFLGATDVTINYVLDYLGIIALFIPFYITSYNFEVLIKADGYPKKAIITTVAGATTNILLDYVFVILFSWGIKGAAIATGMAQVMTFSVYLIHFISSKSGFSFVRVKYRLSKALQLAKLGVADSVTELSVGICIFVYNKVLLVVSGNDGIVIYTVISYFSQLILMTMMGINQGTQPLISYFHGRERKDFCAYIFRIALICALTGSAIAFMIGMFFSRVIIGIYIDPVINYELYIKGAEFFRLYSLSFLPLGIVIILMGYFTATENPWSAMSVSIGRGAVFSTVAVILMAFFLGEKGVFFSATISESCSLVLALILYRKKHHAQLL